jgi:hypothetical protein
MCWQLEINIICRRYIDVDGVGKRSASIAIKI